MSHNASYANSSVTTSNFTTFFSLGSDTTIDDVRNNMTNKKYSDIFTEVSMKSKLGGSDTCSGKDCIVAVKCNTSQGWYPYNKYAGVTSWGGWQSVTSTRLYAYTTDAKSNEIFNSAPKAQTCYHEPHKYYCQNGVDCKGWKVCASSTGTSCVDFKYYIRSADFNGFNEYDRWAAQADHFAGQNSKEVWPIICVKGVDRRNSYNTIYYYVGSLYFDFDSTSEYDIEEVDSELVRNCYHGNFDCYYYVVRDSIYENGEYYYNVNEPYIDWDNIEDIDDPDEVRNNTYDPEFWSYDRPAGMTADQMCQKMIESRAVGCESAGYQPWHYSICFDTDWVCTPDNLFARGSRCYSKKRRKTCEEYNDPSDSTQYSSTNSCPSGYYLDGTGNPAYNFNDMSCYVCVKSGS